MAPTVQQQQKHEVFLSFRGEDTRLNFTSHLRWALERKGIGYFIDDQVIRGEEISQALLTAIEESKISIIVLSKNYASSSWCLDELSKILECKKINGQIVVPIFYHVDPSDVRNQKVKSFEDAFEKHQERFTNKVERWRAALAEVALLAGHHSDPKKDRPESTLIVEIVEGVSKKLMYKSLYDTKSMVGIDSRIEGIESLLCIDSVNFRIVGIWGMGGIGKTTIADVVYNRLFADFEGCCFVNVREELKYGRVRLREELLSKILEDRNLNVGTSSLPAFINDRLRRKKVLIVLDDVNDSMQLDFLPEKHCFGHGSRIIITSRDKQVLRQVVDVIYEVKGLTNDEGFQLFSLYAFKQSHPTEEFLELSKKVVHYAGGIPLALRVLGSALYGRGKLDWEGDLNKLKEIPNPKIDNILRISYDGLDGEVQDIFLDIACFFKMKDRDYVTDILDGCYISTMSGISVLIDKSLLTISHNMLEMHDLLQQMAWNIVRQESKEPGKRTRLWIPEDVYHVLKNNTGTETVEGMFIDMSKIRELRLSPTAFVRMYNLKLLKFYYSLKSERKVYLSQQGLEFLPDNLSYLHWDDYPSKSLPSNFCPVNLVELSMPNSHVKRLWNGVQNLVKLKCLNLHKSQHLIKIPDLSRATNLERMELDGCTSLVEVPSSIRYLNKLSYLTLQGCQNLGNFPSNVYLRSLTTLLLDGCSNITKFPEISGNLETLSLSGTAIEEVPLSIGCLSRLTYLNLGYCRRLERLPSSICKLKFLENLNLYGCLKLHSFPEILETMKCLEWLSLSHTSIEELPSSVEHMVGLIDLQLDYCENLKNLPSSIRKLKSLKYLTLRNCSNITKFQAIPWNLMMLDLSGTAIEQVPSSFECLTYMSSLRTLDLSGNNFETIPASIKQILELKKLNLSYCKRLQSLPELPPNLQYLNAHSCTSLEAISGSFTICLGSWSEVLFANCLKLDQNAISHILAESQLRIQHRATEALKLYLEGFVQNSSLTICLPGSEIPEWFSCQSTGSSMTTQLPLYGDDRKFVGFALCVVVACGDHDKSRKLIVKCKYNFKTNRGDHRDDFCHLFNGKRSVGSDHVFLGYDFSLDHDWYNEVSACHFNEVSFEFYALDVYCSQACCKVKKCGVHLIYARNDPTICEEYGTIFCPVSLQYNARVIQASSNENFAAIHQPVLHQSCESGSGISDLPYTINAEECNSIMIHRPSSPCDSTWLSLKCGVINQDFGEPTQEDGTTIKRSDDGHHNNEAKPSGNLSSDEVEDESRLKRLKCV